MNEESKAPQPLTPGPGGRVIVARYGRDLEDFTVGDLYDTGRGAPSPQPTTSSSAC